jgi:hypothetical protein
VIVAKANIFLQGATAFDPVADYSFAALLGLLNRALADQAMLPIEAIEASLGAERLLWVRYGCWQLATAIGVAAAMPHLQGKIGRGKVPSRLGK